MITLKTTPYMKAYIANIEGKTNYNMSNKVISWYADKFKMDWNQRRHLTIGNIRGDIEKYDLRVDEMVIEIPTSATSGWSWRYDSGACILPYTRKYCSKRKRTAIDRPLKRKTHRDISKLPFVAQWFARWRRTCRIVFHEETDYVYVRVTMITKRRKYR